MKPIEPKWGLSDEKILEALNVIDPNFQDVIWQSDRRIIRATLRHVQEEGEKVCLHRLFKRECDICWAELAKEAGL